MLKESIELKTKLCLREEKISEKEKSNRERERERERERRERKWEIDFSCLMNKLRVQPHIYNVTCLRDWITELILIIQISSVKLGELNNSKNWWRFRANTTEIWFKHLTTSFSLLQLKYQIHKTVCFFLSENSALHLDLKTNGHPQIQSFSTLRLLCSRSRIEYKLIILNFL